MHWNPVECNSKVSITSSEFPTCTHPDLLAFDLFEAQPVKNANVYVMRYIAHNWSDPYVIKILRRLRQAAGPHSKLILLDHIIDYLSHETGDILNSVPGAARPMAQAPLLPYPDSAIGCGYLLDILVSTLHPANHVFNHILIEPRG